MNPDLWLDSQAIMIAFGLREIVEPSVQFMTKVNCLDDRSDL